MAMDMWLYPMHKAPLVEADNYPDFFLGRVRLLLDQADLLILHLHDDFYPVAVRYGRVIFTAIQDQHASYALRGDPGNVALGADELHQLYGIIRRQGVRVGPQQLPQLVGGQGRACVAVLNDDIRGSIDGGQMKVVGQAGQVNDNVGIVRVRVDPPAHGGGEAGIHRVSTTSGGRVSGASISASYHSLMTGISLKGTPSFRDGWRCQNQFPAAGGTRSGWRRDRYCQELDLLTK